MSHRATLTVASRGSALAQIQTAVEEINQTQRLIAGVLTEQVATTGAILN